MTIHIQVNGEPTILPEGSSVADLLKRMGQDPARVAVERNRDVVPRATFDSAVLIHGDEVEVVTFVGGG